MVVAQDFFDLGASAGAARPNDQARGQASGRPNISPGSFPVPTLVWDTETAGLANPAICQLAYVLYEGGRVEEYDRILRLPHGVRMSKDATAIHKITEQASAAGEEAGGELLAFCKLVDRVQTAGGVVAGHNVRQFDCRAVNFTMQKHGLPQEIDPKHMLDTMQDSKDHSPLRTVKGRTKNFKLSELYEHLYGCPPSWAVLHNALDDVRVTALCYLGGRRMGWW